MQKHPAFLFSAFGNPKTPPLAHRTKSAKPTWLGLRLRPPPGAHQPGHLMVAAYDAAMADRLAIEIDQGLAAEQLQQQARDEAARKSSSNAVKWIILASVGAAVTIVVCWAIIYASIYSGISSLY
jgi:hypothetical protein